MGVSRVRLLVVNAALAILAALITAPVAWMVSASFMAKGEATRVPAALLPRAPTLFQYDSLFRHYAIGRPMLNSLVLSLLITALSLMLMVPAGYAFAKLRFAGREALLRVIVALMVVPGQIAMLPLFLMLKEVGLVNTYAGVIAPWLAGMFGVLFVRQAALGIPDEMLDAARLDGAGEYAILRHVVEPMLRPVTVTLALFTFLGSWNDFLWPLIVLSDQNLYTLPVALATLSREHVQDAELMMAGAVVTTVPILLVFLAMQRHYIGGLTSGGVKG